MPSSAATEAIRIPRGEAFLEDPLRLRDQLLRRGHRRRRRAAQQQVELAEEERAQPVAVVAGLRAFADERVEYPAEAAFAVVEADAWPGPAGRGVDLQEAVGVAGAAELGVPGSRR